MSKSERSELGQLIRKRERVMKAAAAERALKMISEFDSQCASIHSYDDDAIWKTATKSAEQVVNEANAKIKQRCQELGIPAEFAPGISFNWYGRGENAVRSRRVELRRMAISRIQAIEQEARTKIEQLSLMAQTEVIANGLESDAAKTFLEKMPSVDSLMPMIDVPELKRISDKTHSTEAE
jgi:hypothetical protein